MFVEIVPILVIEKNDRDGHLNGWAAGWLVFSELLGLRRLLVRTEVR